MSSKSRVGVVNIRKQFRKTKMCSYHQAGRCTFGAQCFYAHTPEEMESAPDLKKTKLCTAWQEGTCSKSDCQFAHGAKELRSTTAVYKTVQCQWFGTGHCSLGAACRYAHGDVEDRSAALPQEGKKKKKKSKKAQPKNDMAAFPFPGLNTEFMRNLDGQQKDILTQIVALCSQINADGLPRPPPGLELPVNPMLFPEEKFSGVHAGLATPSTIASTNPSPLFLPTDYRAFNAFVEDKTLSPMRDMKLPAPWLDDRGSA
jgi:hypothetical protein